MAAFIFGLIVLLMWLEKKGIISATPQKPRRSSSSSSSYRSSSRRSDDDVDVEIKFYWQIDKNKMAVPVTKEVSMSRAEYKSLLNGSMKARIAYVTNNFRGYAVSGKVTDVSISLA
jgi:hypothetical protein